MEKEFEVKELLEKERKNIDSFDELVSFIKKVKDNYNCGYGSAPRAIAQAALATAWYLSKEFGITGFQAGFVMWDFIFGWRYTNNKCGMKIINYDEMLYPQYDYKFTKKTLSEDTFRALQKEAKNRLKEDSFANRDVVQHWEAIATGGVPFGYDIE